jgi:hypothetical protein
MQSVNFMHTTIKCSDPAQKHENRDFFKKQIPTNVKLMLTHLQEEEKMHDSPQSLQKLPW